jgi:hypothetical protein
MERRHIQRVLLVVGIVGAVSCILPACEEEGPAEKAGKKVDKAVKDTGKAIEDAGKKIQNPK